MLNGDATIFGNQHVLSYQNEILFQNEKRLFTHSGKNHRCHTEYNYAPRSPFKSAILDYITILVPTVSPQRYERMLLHYVDSMPTQEKKRQ